MSDERIAKLPKWAQDYIENLNQQVMSHERTIRALENGHPGSNVAMRPLHGMLATESTLPPDALITFYMEPDQPDNERFIREGIQVHHMQDAYGPELYLRSTHGRLTVLPSASNSVRIRLDKR